MGPPALVQGRAGCVQGLWREHVRACMGAYVRACMRANTFMQALGLVPFMPPTS